jgi:hypothetical protein
MLDESFLRPPGQTPGAAGVLFVKDTRSCFVINNLAHLRVLGATRPEEVVGKTDLDFFPRKLARHLTLAEPPAETPAQALAPGIRAQG